MSALKGSQVDNLTFHLKKPGKENKLYDKGGLAADGPGGGGRRGLDPAEGQPLTCPPSCPTTWPQTQAGMMVASPLPAGPAHQAHPAPQGTRGDQEGPRGWSERRYRVTDRTQRAVCLGVGGRGHVPETTQPPVPKDFGKSLP